MSGGVAATIAELKRAPGENIWLVGGGEIVAECLRFDLIDEWKLFVHPIILGSGIPLFARGLPTRALKFVRCERFDSGLVQLWYRRA